MRTTWLYQQSETPSEAPPHGLYTVGFYRLDDGKWVPESDHGTPTEAAARVHYLNGGAAAQRAMEEAL